MDIKLESSDMNFNVRCSSIIKDCAKEHVILTHMRAVDGAYILPGGRAEILENTVEAVAREIFEELGQQLDYQLISVQENIVKQTGFHMIEFVFYAEAENLLNIQKLDDGWDRFAIIRLQDIDRADIRPKPVKELILRDTYDEITHSINYDWA